LLAALALPALGLAQAVPAAVAVTTQSLWLVACGAWLMRRSA
jgi:hypothetical protein